MSGCFSDNPPDKDNNQKKNSVESSKKNKGPSIEKIEKKSLEQNDEPTEIFEPINLRGTIRFKLNCYETALKDLELIFGNKVIDGEVKFEKNSGVSERRLRPRIKKNIIELGNISAGEYYYMIVGPRIRIMKPRKLILSKDKGLTIEVKDFEAWKVFIMTDVPLSKLPLKASLVFPKTKEPLIVNRKFYDYFSFYIQDKKPYTFDFKAGSYQNNGAPKLEHVEGTLYIFNIKLKKTE